MRSIQGPLIYMNGEIVMIHRSNEHRGGDGELYKPGDQYRTGPAAASANKCPCFLLKA